MKKKLTVFMLGMSILAGLTACGKSEPAPAPSSEASGEPVFDESGAEMIDENTYLTGDKIVKDPITLRVDVSSGALTGNLNTLTWVEQLEKDTNIDLDINHMNSGDTNEQVSLIFNTQDYPDIFFGGPTPQQLNDCVEAGVLYPLDDLIEQYAPNWKKYLDENPYVRKLITYSDGHIYSLPCVRDEVVQNGIRDQWLINKAWLDELGLPVPATDIEFVETMQAFKDNAGKGSIPEGVIPYYFRYNYFIGSQLDFYAAYGVVVPGDRDTTYISIGEDGKTAEYEFTNEDIKAPVKTLNDMYKRGLIPGSVFTDDWNEYLNKTRSESAFIGSFHSFHNPNPDVYVAMPPFRVEGVENSYIRSQLNQYAPGYFTIFKDNPYPEASIRLADVIADHDRSITGFYGTFGEYLEKQADGTYLQLPQEADSQMKENCPGNCIPLLITAEMGDKITYDGALKVRQDAVEMYKPYILPVERLYPRLLIPQEDQTEFNELQNNINDLSKQQFALWITEGGIDKGWDAYLKDLEMAGLPRYMELSQKFFDDFNQR